MPDLLAKLAQRPDAAGRLARIAQVQVSLWRFSARRLRHYNVYAMSAALSFRTIFALVPTLVLALLAANTFGVLEDRKRGLRDFLEATGFAQISVTQDGDGHEQDAPSSAEAGSRGVEAVGGSERRVEIGLVGGEGAEQPAASAPGFRPAVSLADEIEKVVARVEGKLTFRRVGPIGGALLIWTALGLLSTIEGSLNRIFGAPQSRSMIRRVVRYWSVATLGPVALTLTIYVAHRAIEICAPIPVVGWAVAGLGRLIPVIVGVVMVAFVYMIFPNAAVRARSAAGGAVAAVMIWIAAKWAFGLYIERFVANGNLYGVLGVIPLFLLWLNLTWLVFLFGAELAHTSANLRRMQSAELAERLVLSPSDALAVALSVARSFNSGRGAASIEAIASQLTLPDISIRWLLDRLTDHGILVAVQHDRSLAYTMSRPPQAVPVARIFEIFGVDGQYTTAASADSDVSRGVVGVEDRVRGSLAGLTLADVMEVRRNRDERNGRSSTGC